MAFGVGPEVPIIPGPSDTLLNGYVPPVPNVFSVGYSQDTTAFQFTVGYTGQAYALTSRFVGLTFNVYFLPLSGAPAAAIANPQLALGFYKNATLVESIGAPAVTGIVTFTNSRFLTVDGWFWATASNPNGQSSTPTMPYRSPAGQNLINFAIPPNVSNPAVSKTSPTVDGEVYSLVKASATVPSNNTGVINVVMNAFGSGYAPGAGTTVAFSNGLAPGGTQAAGTPIVNPSGQITGVQLSTSGNGYVSPPTVTFTGAGSNAAGTALLGSSTNFDGFQLYLTNYLAGGQTEGPYVTSGGAAPGTTIFSQFYMIPDGVNTTTFTFVSVSRAGVRSTSGAPTATLIV